MSGYKIQKKSFSLRKFWEKNELKYFWQKTEAIVFVTLSEEYFSKEY